MTTTRSCGLICPRSRSLISAASATPVCGQLNMPVRSARAEASASSASVACSTMPLYFCSARMAFFTDTGLPIWIAEASVGFAVIGLELPVVLVGQIQRVGGGGLRDDDSRALRDETERLHHVEARAERADVSEVPAGNDDDVGHRPVELLHDLDADGLLSLEPQAVHRVGEVHALFDRQAAARSPCSRRSRCRATARARRWRAAARAAPSRPCRAAG